MPIISGNWTCVVKAPTDGYVRIRKSPSTSAIIIASVSNGSVLKSSKLDFSREWYYIDEHKGWANKNYLEVAGNTSNTTATQIPPQQNQTVASNNSITNNNGTTYDKSIFNRYEKLEEIMEKVTTEYLKNLENSSTSNTSSFLTKNLNGIYGIPYQFMDSVDQKIPDTKIGRIYADKIITRMPLLLLSPGRVNFMRDYKSKTSASQALISAIDKLTPVELDSLVSGTGRYYTFDFDYKGYYNAVNMMIKSGSKFLSLQDTMVNVTGKWQKLSNVEWQNAGNDGHDFKGLVSNKEYVAFYMDSTNQVTESISNTTTQSQLASLINQASDLGREMQFILGNTGFTDNMDESFISKAISQIDDISKKYLSGNKLLTDITSGFSTIAIGGKLIFPEIWNDSSFSKNYSISFKLRTPDGDKLSWFLNIYVPLCHLICMAAPIQAENTAAGYKSPYLIRGSYKGLFNCDMGIITDLNISKGKEGAWTIDGLPTEVDIDITLKDLYSYLSISPENSVGRFVNNIGLINYLSNTCGVNFNDNDFGIMFQIYWMLQWDKVVNFLPDIWTSLEQEFANMIMNLNKKLKSWLL